MADERGIASFLDALASNAPSPGGGAAAALAGALAAACAEMVGRFTVGRPRFAAVEQRAAAAVERLVALRATLLAQMAADERAFAAVSAAYKLPKGTDEERAARQSAIQAALIAAMAPPLEVMRRGCDTLEAASELAAAGNPSVVSDAACAAILGEAAVRAAAVNVRANTALLGDSPAAGQAEHEAARREVRAAALRDQTLVAAAGRGRGAP
ncbi:MAG TPA: cyclodeaminase/cyclohydrolase family protein [Ktedonobacterales bacterium]|nr:cyclodeaminase/cyclohydrolase family protein [Ktedonobacterales bacterium]